MEAATNNNCRVELDRFFADVQPRAYAQILLALKNKDDAMDLLQDAMIKLAQKYPDQPENWPKLFQRIMQNLIRDFYRKKKIRKIMFWFQQTDSGADNLESSLSEDMEIAVDGFRQIDQTEPDRLYTQQRTFKEILKSVSDLPLRQQQAFLLRAWQGQSTEETADIMGCSTGSVKTHYSRALANLRDTLAAHEIFSGGEMAAFE